MTTLGQHKQGTNKAHAIMCAQTVGEHPMTVLDAQAIKPLVQRSAIVQKVAENALKTGVPIKGFMADRGLFSASVVTAMERLQQRFIIGAPVSKRIRSVWQANSRSAFTTRNTLDEVEEVVVVHDYVFGERKSARATASLIIARRQTGNETLFGAWVTNFACTSETAAPLLSAYRSRWGIETGFRCEKEARAVTTASNPPLRLALILVSLLLYNLWRLVQWSSRNRTNPAVEPPLYYYIFRHTAAARLCRRILAGHAA